MILNFSPNFCKATVNFLLGLIFSKYNLGSYSTAYDHFLSNYMQISQPCCFDVQNFILCSFKLYTILLLTSGICQKKRERETNTCLQLLFELDSLCTWKKISLFLNLLTNNNFVAAFEWCIGYINFEFFWLGE